MKVVRYLRYESDAHLQRYLTHTLPVNQHHTLVTGSLTVTANSRAGASCGTWQRADPSVRVERKTYVEDVCRSLSCGAQAMAPKEVVVGGRVVRSRGSTQGTLGLRRTTGFREHD